MDTASHDSRFRRQPPDAIGQPPHSGDLIGITAEADDIWRTVAQCRFQRAERSALDRQVKNGHRMRRVYTAGHDFEIERFEQQKIIKTTGKFQRNMRPDQQNMHVAMLTQLVPYDKMKGCEWSLREVIG